MNRRRCRKQLHRQKNQRSFWGQRGYLTIRLPASVVPVEPDMSMFEVYGPKEDSIIDSRCIETSHGTKVFQVSSCVTSGGYPCDQDRTIFDIKSTEYGGWSWSEIRHVWVPQDKSRFKFIYLPVPDEHVKRASEHIQWTNIVEGSYKEKNLPKVVETLVRYFWPKTHYVAVTKDYYEFTYSVKPWYVRQFVRDDLNRVLNELDRMVKNGDLPWYKVLR